MAVQQRQGFGRQTEQEAGQARPSANALATGRGVVRRWLARVHSRHSRHTDADDLAKFAATWHADTRPVSRELLYRYLDEPMNAVRHEPLVKRLFKLVEASGEDVTMGRFLVAFDRAVRRERAVRQHYRYENERGWGREVIESEEEILLSRFEPMPRGKWSVRAIAQGTTKTHKLRLFSTKTRNYLRRRAWRYFRKLGRSAPDRYLPAITDALTRYTDDDVADGVALLDNWGLVHVLFHHCPALKSRPTGWTIADGQSLAGLAPAPMFNALWKANPDAALGLLDAARCRVVRQWAIRWLQTESPETLDRIPVETLLGWVARGIPDLAEFAIDRLKRASGLENVSADRWLSLIESAPAEVLDLVCELVERYVSADKLTLAETVRLAMQRPTPIARLALGWLRAKQPTGEADVEALLSLRDAPAEPVRPDLCRQVALTLSGLPQFQSAWVLDFLDGRHADVRRVGSDWLDAEPRAKDDPTVWQRLLESPYDDVRLKMVDRLEQLAGQADAQYDLDHVRLLWATVLLNVHRGGRTKPVVVRQLLDRLTTAAHEALQLLPLLAVAVRSTRGPEFRAGLTALVQLLDRRPEMAAEVEAAFPEFSRAALV